MLKKLQKRFMAIALFALASLTIVQTIGVNVINIYQRDSDLRSTLKIIAANKGVLPSSSDDDYDIGSFFNPFGDHRLSVETPYTTKYFVVEMQGNVVTNISTENAEDVNDKTAFNYAAKIYNTDPGFGLIDNYRYYYTVSSTGKAMIVFIDMTRDLAQVTALATISVFVNIITITALVILVYWLSKKAMKPVATSIEKQKQFITDASHELKTPLAIISANAEVLEMCDGENEWLTSIKNQTIRMNHLVKKLVELSKLNEMSDKDNHTLFNISSAFLDTAANFETSAAVANKNLSYSAANDLEYYGDEGEIRQLITILCDNALKYTDECGHINLSLYKSGKNIIIESFNTCEYIDPNTVSHLFDRFYRGDSSRAREEKVGGYGIGLSIAQAIVHRHGGKIKVSTTGTTGITFKVTL